ncbi:hypothetical protein BEH94_04970 [Candidatus Altiarchaeales archaeon WOR_SM1_SCG]|nr:hypothetical protein BEH94_04970 [Candidatus Altiarchaeales archaeon WOR_SM1_SCG]
MEGDVKSTKGRTIQEIQNKITKKQNRDCLLGVLLMIGFLFGSFCLGYIGGSKEISNTHESVVFKTGSAGLTGFITLFAAFGVIIFVFALTDFKKNEIGGLYIMLFIGLFLLGIVIYGLYCITYANPEYVVIDKTAEEIRVEKHYLSEDKIEYRVAFRSIKSVKFEYGEYWAAEMLLDYGKVKLVISDELEILVSKGGQEFNYKMAKAISNATGKELEEVERNL